MGALRLKGSSGAFTGIFKKTLEDCGYTAIVEKKDEGNEPDKCVHDVFIYEVRKKGELSGISENCPSRPYIIFTGLEFSYDEMSPLREKGLVGIIKEDSSPEETAFLVNKAFFYKKRNPRVAVNLAVGLTGPRIIKTFASLLSRDGMFVVTLHPLPVDSQCDLSFEVPGLKKKFRTKARVIYNIEINKDLNIIANPHDPFKRVVTHPGMAVYFIDLPEEDRKSIDSYIKTVE